MKPLLKVMAILASLFASTFVAARLLGVLTEANIREWLEAASGASPWWLAALVFAFLFVDLLVAVPTLTITVLAGYFLGFSLGLATTFAGTAAAAAAGYALSARYGERLLGRVVAKPAVREEMRAAFLRHGPAMILLSRAAPILPEVTACMAGATGMAATRYFLLFTLGTLPYVAIASYAGSISTLENPMPAIYAAIGLYGVMWTGWLVFQRRTRQGRLAPTPEHNAPQAATADPNA